MKVIKDDKVVVLSGKDKGKQGKVLSADPKHGKVVVEGVNLCAHHIKARKPGEESGIIKSENLTIDADGYVGLKHAPLLIDVTSTVSIRSNFRDVNYRQLWNEASDTNGEGEGVGAGGGLQLASTRSGLLPGTGDALGDSTPLSLVSLLIGMACVAAGFRRRRRKVSRRARSMA